MPRGWQGCGFGRRAWRSRAICGLPPGEAPFRAASGEDDDDDDSFCGAVRAVWLTLQQWSASAESVIESERARRAGR